MAALALAAEGASSISLAPLYCFSPGSPAPSTSMAPAPDPEAPAAAAGSAAALSVAVAGFLSLFPRAGSVSKRTSRAFRAAAAATFGPIMVARNATWAMTGFPVSTKGLTSSEGPSLASSPASSSLCDDGEGTGAGGWPWRSSR